MTNELNLGDSAPDFSLMAVGGKYGADEKLVSLKDFAGKTVVLYFYPKDDTPGCTTQACELREKWQHFVDSGAEVFGVSINSAESHRNFIKKYSLPFSLISDPDHKLIESYGLWVEKSLYGKKHMGTERATFVIASDGTIKSIFRRVKPKDHAEQVLEDLRKFEP
ncbi:MAG: thioredoxin-dependent thiol peroxidase [Chthoniobacterales bacterium]